MARKTTRRRLRKVRVAMIGAGSMANRVHYPSLASFSNVAFAAVCDLDPERLKTTADTYGIEKRYTDYRKMIAETAPHAVYAIGPPHILYDVGTWCLREGQNLCIEKPMGSSRIRLSRLMLQRYPSSWDGLPTLKRPLGNRYKTVRSER